MLSTEVPHKSYVVKLHCYFCHLNFKLRYSVVLCKITKLMYCIVVAHACCRPLLITEDKFQVNRVIHTSVCYFQETTTYNYRHNLNCDLVSYCDKLRTK